MKGCSYLQLVATSALMCIAICSGSANLETQIAAGSKGALEHSVRRLERLDDDDDDQEEGAEEVEGKVFKGYEKNAYRFITNTIQDMKGAVTGFIGGLNGYTGSQSAIADSFAGIHALGFWFPAPFYVLFEYYMTVVQWVEFQLNLFRLHPVFLKFEYYLTYFDNVIWGEVLQHYEGKQISSKERKDTPERWQKKADKVSKNMLATKRDFSQQKAMYEGPVREDGGAVLHPEMKEEFQQRTMHAVPSELDNTLDSQTPGIQITSQESWQDSEEDLEAPSQLQSDIDYESEHDGGIFLQQPSPQVASTAETPNPRNSSGNGLPQRIVGLMSSLKSQDSPLIFDKARVESLTSLRGALNGLAGIVTTFAGLGGYCGCISGLHGMFPSFVTEVETLIEETWNDFPSEREIHMIGEMRYASSMFYTHALKFIGNKYTGFLQLSYLSTYFSQYLTTATLWVSTHNFFANYGQVTPHVPTFLKDQGYWTSKVNVWGDLGPLVPKPTSQQTPDNALSSKLAGAKAQEVFAAAAAKK